MPLSPETQSKASLRWSCFLLWLQALGGAVSQTERCFSPLSPHHRQWATSCLVTKKLSSTADFLRFQNLVAGADLGGSFFSQQICLRRIHSRMRDWIEPLRLTGAGPVNFWRFGPRNEAFWGMMNNYTFIRVVGKGSYGEVNLVKHKTDRKQVRNRERL